MHARKTGHASQVNRATILVSGGFVINGACPVKFLALGRDGVTITSFSRKHSVN